ncbi:MAG: 2-keto-4-pentenoate hydratase [Lysobacterales bacterium]
MPKLETPLAPSYTLSPDLDAISQRLVTARGNADSLPDFPGTLPDNLADAYAIQTASMSRWPDKVLGWKVGMVPEIFRAPLAAERLCGPIFQSSVCSIEPGLKKVMPIFNGGFAAVEAEFVFQLATTFEPVDRHYSDGELIEHIAALHVGAEVASSPMADVNKLGPCCVVSDFGNNAGLIVGPQIPNWSSLPLTSLTAEVSVDSTVVGTATADAIEGGLLEALRFLVALCAKRQLTLEAGTYISTGAVTGIHEVTPDSNSTVDFGDFGAFDVAFQSMTPGQLHSPLAQR